MAAPGGGVARLVAGPDHHADLLDIGSEGLLDQDAEHGLLLPVAIDQGLQGQRALALAGGGDDSFLDAQRSSWVGGLKTCPEDNCSPAWRVLPKPGTVTNFPNFPAR